MTTEENKSLVRRYFEILNRGEVAALDELLSPNYKRYLLPTAASLTPDTQKQRLAGLRAAFPDLHLTLEDMFAEGDRIACRVMLRGTHQGTFQGIPPTGKQVTVFAFDIIRIQDGKLIEHWGGPDLFSMLLQVGAVFSAGQEKDKI